MIYLASPYNSDYPAVCEQRFQAACRCVAWLMRQGHHVMSPIAMSHPIAMTGDLPKDWDYWKSQDAWFLRHCDSVVVLTLEGWEDSHGIKAELEIAKGLGLPITYVSPEEVA